MIPIELKRDAAGLDRLARIRRADELVAEARRMGRLWPASSDGPVDSLAELLTYRGYFQILYQAADLYAGAGLGVLSTWVEVAAASNPASGWSVFDGRIAELRKEA